MTSITVPEPVMSLAIAPKNRESSGAFSKALNRFTKEDPTFKVGMDAESGQTIISGMGELHLDIYVERMKREYKVRVKTESVRDCWCACCQSKSSYWRHWRLVYQTPGSDRVK